MSASFTLCAAGFDRGGHEGQQRLVTAALMVGPAKDGKLVRVDLNDVGLDAKLPHLLELVFALSLPRAVAFMRERHPVKTAEHVSADTGVSTDTVREWLDGIARPGFDHYSAMIAVYGLPFLSAAIVTKPRWLTDAAHAERVSRAQDALMRAKADLDHATEARL
jgi:hypothetical protein